MSLLETELGPLLPGPDVWAIVAVAVVVLSLLAVLVGLILTRKAKKG